MDPITIEKLQAMKRYKRKGFLHRIACFLLGLVSLGLFLSCPLWFPKLYFLLRCFFLVCLPNIREVLLGPKFLFIVCNLIVVVLLRESKQARGSAPDIYEEYLRRNRSMATKVVEKNWKEDQEVKGGDDVCDEEDEVEEDVVEEEEEIEGDGESGEIPAEELNRKVEEFIAKTNKKRMLESKMLDSE